MVLVCICPLFVGKLFLCRGGSRTSPRRGRQSLGGGRLPNILIIFSEKPYEIKEILVCRGARAGCAPLNPPLHEPMTGSILLMFLRYPYVIFS